MRFGELVVPASIRLLLLFFFVLLADCMHFMNVAIEHSRLFILLLISRFDFIYTLFVVAISHSAGFSLTQHVINDLYVIYLRE